MYATKQPLLLCVIFGSVPAAAGNLVIAVVPVVPVCTVAAVPAIASFLLWLVFLLILASLLFSAVP
jgi:hypothetical protein